MSTNKLKKLEEAALDLGKAEEAINGLSYDSFKQSDAYKGLKNSYEHQGRRAMQDTIGQIAARTGGMASSYATSAANQSYNNYMQGLEDAARSLFNDEYSRAKDKYNTAYGEYNTAYGEYRDAVGDDRYDKELEYQENRDKVSDQRYATEVAEKNKAQAQSDVLAIWATGGTPTQKQLEDAGWYDANAKATGEDSHLNNVSNLGRAYYTQATAEPTPEFRPVSAEDFEYYYEMFDGVVDQDLADMITYAIADATGNQDFADSLYRRWLYEHENPIKS